MCNYVGAVPVKCGKTTCMCEWGGGEGHWGRLREENLYVTGATDAIGTWAPVEFFVRGSKPKIGHHKGKKAPQMVKKVPYKEKKAPYMEKFPRGGKLPLVSPYWVPMYWGW